MALLAAPAIWPWPPAPGSRRTPAGRPRSPARSRPPSKVFDTATSVTVPSIAARPPGRPVRSPGAPAASRDVSIQSFPSGVLSYVDTRSLHICLKFYRTVQTALSFLSRVWSISIRYGFGPGTVNGDFLRRGHQTATQAQSILSIRGAARHPGAAGGRSADDRPCPPAARRAAASASRSPPAKCSTCPARRRRPERNHDHRAGHAEGRGARLSGDARHAARPAIFSEGPRRRHALDQGHVDRRRRWPHQLRDVAFGDRPRYVGSAALQRGPAHARFRRQRLRGRTRHAYARHHRRLSGAGDRPGRQRRGRGLGRPAMGEHAHIVARAAGRFCRA